MILLEGTLTFTTKHLIFVSSNGNHSETTTDESAPESEAGNTDSEDPEVTVADSDTFSIPLSSIVSVEGKRGMFRPSLTVYWRDDAQNETSKMEFIQKTRHVSTSGNINDWESKIHHLSTAQVMVAQEINSAMHSAEPRSVPTKILGVLNDGEWKGLIQIERELREQYGTEIDIDELETQCNKLVTEKILERDKIGEFYRKLNVQGSEQ